MAQDIYMSIAGAPIWVWVTAAIVAAHVGMLAAAIAWDIVKKHPLKSVRRGDNNIELWVRERRLPSSDEAIVVPVATDLKMSTGIAKWVRDATADAIQQQALKHAPLAPGEAIIGAGGKFRFGAAVLAVVMDDKKRTSPDWITEAVARAIELAREEGAQSIVIPDFTEDLLRQPQWVNDQQRRDTCAPIARAILQGVLAAREDMETVRIWVWRKGNEDIYVQELNRLEQDSAHGHARIAHA